MKRHIICLVLLFAAAVAGAQNTPSFVAVSLRRDVVSQPGSRSTMKLTSDCILVQSDGSVRREHVAGDANGSGWGESYEGQLSTADVSALSAAVSNDDFRALKTVSSSSTVTAEDVIVIQVVRAGGQQHLSIPDPRSFNQKPLRPLLAWWKTADKLKLTKLKGARATGCKWTPPPPEPKRAVVASDLGSILEAAEESVPFKRVFLRHAVPSRGGGVADCLLVSPDGTYRREHGEKWKWRTVFEGKLSPEQTKELLHIVNGRSFRAMHTAPFVTAYPRDFPAAVVPLSGRENWLDVRIFRYGGHQVLVFPDVASREPYEQILAPLLAWWKSVEQQNNTAATVSPTGCRIDPETGEIRSTK